MVVKVKFVSLDDVMQKCHARYAVYSPSRGKVFNFNAYREHKEISSSTLKAVTGLGNKTSFYNRYDAEEKKGIAIAEGWTDAVVKMIYCAPSYFATTQGNDMVSGPALLVTNSMIPDIQDFAQWLITNNYVQLVNMVGDL